MPPADFIDEKPTVLFMVIEMVYACRLIKCPGQWLSCIMEKRRQHQLRRRILRQASQHIQGVLIGVLPVPGTGLLEPDEGSHLRHHLIEKIRTPEPLEIFHGIMEKVIEDNSIPGLQKSLFPVVNESRLLQSC